MRRTKRSSSLIWKSNSGSDDRTDQTRLVRGTQVWSWQSACMPAGSASDRPGGERFVESQTLFNHSLALRAGWLVVLTLRFLPTSPFLPASRFTPPSKPRLPAELDHRSDQRTTAVTTQVAVRSPGRSETNSTCCDTGSVLPSPV